MDPRMQAFFEKRPELKERVARSMFRTRLLLASKASVKARFVGYDHELFHHALRDNCNKNGRELHSLMHLQHILNAMRALGRQPGGEILEIGAGRAGLPILLLLCGFDRIHINEMTNVVNCFQNAHAETLQVLASIMGVARRRLEDVVVPVDAHHCAIRPGMLRLHAFTDAAALDITPGTLSAVISFTVLEHLRDPHAVFRHLRSCLAPDGWMCHLVDLRDHEDFTDPLRFLTVPAAQYRNLRGEWCNRLRHSDFLALFRSTGFEICAARVTRFNELDERRSTDFWKMLVDGLQQVYRDDLPPHEVWVTDDMVARLHPEYRRYARADLSILQSEYVLRAAIAGS